MSDLESYNYIRETFVSKYPSGHVFICMDSSRIKGFDCRKAPQSPQKIILLSEPVRVLGSTVNKQIKMFPSGTAQKIMDGMSNA